MRALASLVPAAALVLVASTATHAAIIPFDLRGRAGVGLLAGNETGTVNGTPGSGGEIGAGIFFNDVTRELTINVGWGSGNGFTDLTGNATVGHIHGLTTSAAPASFNENASVRYGLDMLPGFNNSATSGGFSGVITIAAGDVQALYDGRMYLNFHTAVNGPGEIRGQLVPAPSAAGLALLSVAALRRRRR